MPRFPKLAIFVVTDNDDDRQTKQHKSITLPLAHARGVKKFRNSTYSYCLENVLTGARDLNHLVVHVGRF